MSNTTNTPDAPQQVIYVERAPEPKNGFAIVALLLGVFGLILSLIPLTGWLGIMAGFTAFVLGLVAWKRKRKGRATAGKTAIAGTISGVLAMIMGVISTVIFFNAVDDLSTNLDNMTANTKPVAVTEGAAFTHDGYTADAGWTIKGQFGDPTIRGLTVTNVDHKSSIDDSTTDTPMFTFRLYSGNKTVGEIDCTGNEIAKGESSSMDCISLGSGKWTTYDTVKIDDTF